MRRQIARLLLVVSIIVCALFIAPLLRADEGVQVFNVRNYGATGNKADDAQKAIESAVKACAKAGGGTVYLPPGEYTSGTIHLRNHLRFFIDAGATLYASTNPAQYDRPALLYAEDANNITIEGRGTVE